MKERLKLGKKGGSRHLKRKPAPAFWPIHRKEAVWTVKPNAGPHKIERSLPLTLVLRDMLGVAKTRSEVRAVLSQGGVMVDGNIKKEELFPTGLMDVISIPAVNKQYRVLPSEKGLALNPISKDEAEFKLCRVEDKTVLNGGNVQLNLHDGRNIRIPVKDASKPEEDVFSTSDTVKINLPQQEIAAHFKLAEGASALIVGGKNIGKYGKIAALERREAQKRRKALVTIEDARGNRFQTTSEYVFVVGDAKPQISLPEAA
jgi:small subunit ribosomal protein S4e